MKHLMMLALTTLVLMSCGGKTNSAETTTTATTEEKNYEGMAAELCQCMTPFAELYKEVTEATTAGDTTKAQALLADFQKLSSEGQACAARLEVKYGDFVGEDEIKAKAAFRKKCPEIAALTEPEVATE